MSEWLKEHAWKLIPAARTNSHRSAPTHSPSTTSRNNDAHRRVPINHGVCPGFRGACDTVLTQLARRVTPTNTETYRRVEPRSDQTWFSLRDLPPTTLLRSNFAFGERLSTRPRPEMAVALGAHVAATIAASVQPPDIGVRIPRLRHRPASLRSLAGRGRGTACGACERRP